METGEGKFAGKKAFAAQLEHEAQGLRKQLRAEKDRLERLSSNVQLTKQQIDFFTQETQKAIEGIKDACWRFTKEVCSDLAKIKSPSPALLDLSDKFLFVLEQHDRSWKTFRAICLNYNPLKALMNSISADSFTEEQMSELLPLWKNQQSIIEKLAKVSKGGIVLAEWVCSCVEYRLRKETLLGSQSKLPELERKVKVQLQVIAGKNAEILVMEEKIMEAQAAAEFTSESSSADGMQEPGIVVDTSLVSITSTNPTAKHMSEERVVCIAPLPQGKATGSLVFQMSPRAKKSRVGEFPNFGSGELYRDSPVLTRSTQIDIETESELAGCCSSRFFCY